MTGWRPEIAYRLHTARTDLNVSPIPAVDSHARNGDAGQMTYPGGKNGAGVYQTIINQMPPHQVYIEAFLGGAAVMRYKRPAPLNIGIDLARQPITAARSLFAGNGGTTRSSGATAENGGRILQESRHRRLSPETAVSPARAPSPETARPAAFKFLVRDSIEYLRAYPFQGEELVYCDPPYMHETRGRTDLYEFEMDDAAHRELLRVLKKIPAKVILSGYWSKLYARELRAWRTVTYQTVNRAGKPVREWLWLNFPETAALHDYRYIGTGYRERERIKKRKRRWVARLKRMPILECRALLSAIQEAGIR